MLHEDHIGKTYGRATGIKFVRVNKYRQAIWLWSCECGNEFESRASHLKIGDIVSCGCARREAVRATHTTHGLYTTEPGDWKHPLYSTWKMMIARCLSPIHKDYANYGGRGITIWNPFHNFRRWLECIEEELGPRPKGHTLDRIDNDGHYAPGNLKWSDHKEQRRNQRRAAAELADRIREACIADCTGTTEE